MSDSVWIDGNSFDLNRGFLERLKNFAYIAVLSYNFIFKSRYRVFLKCLACLKHL